MKESHIYLKYLLLAVLLTAIHQIDAQSIIYTLNTSSGGVSQANSGVFSMGETFVGSISADRYAVQGIIQPGVLKKTNLLDSKGITWEVTFYPNPTLENLIIKTDLPIEKVEIFDLKGRRTFYTNYRSGENINLSDLLPGNYVLTIYTKDQARINAGHFIKM